jgi:hypothetical protein
MNSYFKVNKKKGISPFQNTLAYLGGSAIQTIGDNPVTAYRQLVQQFAKNDMGKIISPKDAMREANKVFIKSPLTASLSGLQPRMIGVLLKRIPKFGFLLGYDFMTGGKGEPGLMAATTASILSAPFINPVRMIEKQQRSLLKSTGKEKSLFDILKESKEKNYKPLFRGTVPLMGHSFISAVLGLVGQPKLQKYIQNQIDDVSKFSRSTSNLISSAIVSPVYVVLTNPLSRLEVIMQTNSISNKSINITHAIKEISSDMAQFGLKGIFRGQGVGLAKAIISLSLFHEGRLFMTDNFVDHNKN